MKHYLSPSLSVLPLSPSTFCVYRNWFAMNWEYKTTKKKKTGCKGAKKTISLRKVKSEWGGEMAPALTGNRRVWFQCSIQVILYHSEPQWKSFVSFPTSVWADEKFSALSSTRTLVRATWKSIEVHVFTMHMCCVANAQPDASEIWLWKETSR